MEEKTAITQGGKNYVYRKNCTVIVTGAAQGIGFIQNPSSGRRTRRS